MGYKQLKKDLMKCSKKELVSALLGCYKSDETAYNAFSNTISEYEKELRKAEKEINFLKEQINDEKEVGIRARRIYKALQSNPAITPISLEEKAKALYVFTERLSWRERNKDLMNTLEDQLSAEFETLPIEQREEMMEIFIKLSEGKINLI